MPIGIIDRILLQHDYSADVILAVRSHVDIPRDSKFLIQAPLTGDPNLVIVPPRLEGATPEELAALPILPHEIRPYEEQPKGTNPTTVADLLAEGQGEIRRLDNVLAQLEKCDPDAPSQRAGDARQRERGEPHGKRFDRDRPSRGERRSI